MKKVVSIINKNDRDPIYDYYASLSKEERLENFFKLYHEVVEQHYPDAPKKIQKVVNFKKLR